MAETVLNKESIRNISGIAKNNLILDGIYSDESENFVKKNETGYTITLQTVKDNVDRVYLHFNNNTFSMEKTKHIQGSLFSLYTCTINTKTPITYYFTLVKNGRHYFYNHRGTFGHLDEVCNFKLIPDFEPPLWAKGAVMYQIFVDRFYNGDYSNDVLNREYSYLGHFAKQARSWEEPVGAADFCTFYGGDLQGIIDKLDYLADLGVEVLYLTPIFVSPSNHKYDIQDYEHIDPHFGVIIKDKGKVLAGNDLDNKNAGKYIARTTEKENLRESNKLFAKLVEKSHKKGMKVILDGVFNHSGAFHKWLNKENIYKEKGAYRYKDSPYVDYFRWFGEDWPDNITYDGWWGHSNHPKLNYENSRALYDYILDIGKKWVSPPYNADGWRLDVAADLGHSREYNHKFWRDFRKVVKEANPNAIILGEHYGDCEAWLWGDQWDTIMNYDAFMEPLTWFLTGMQKHSEEYNESLLNNAAAFEGAMRYHMAKMSPQAVSAAMNQLSNHDHSRFLTRTNRTTGRLHTVGKELADTNLNKSIMYEAVVFQMTWPGAPTLYYGDEAGLCGWTDPDNRRPYPWGKEDHKLIAFHQTIINIRKNSPALKYGSWEFLYSEYGVVSYARWLGDEKILVIINNNFNRKLLFIPMWKLDITGGEMKSLILTAYENFSADKRAYNVIDGFMEISMSPFSAIVLRN